MAYLMATVMTALGLLMLAHTPIAMVQQLANSRQSNAEHNPTPAGDVGTPVVGRITGRVDCVWTEGSDPKNPESENQNLKSLVHCGDRFDLPRGLLEITYDTGAKVLLQGPVTYEVDSAAGGYLAIGKLTATLERKNEPRAKKEEQAVARSSFVVRTPTAVVTDLGTEFGVEVDRHGYTTSHVFRGTVELRPISRASEAGKEFKILHADESARVEGKAGDRRIVVVPAAMDSLFVRDVPKPAVRMVDLVDVVSGGDGFSGRYTGGVNPSDGRLIRDIAMVDYYRKHPKETVFQGDGSYHRVEGQPFIDGVFIPDGGRGAIQTDSAGHRFDGFPPTCNMAGGWIHGGGAIPLVDGSGVFMNAISCVLNGVDYSSSNHRVLFVHANKGITFDLEAVRAAHRDHRVSAFYAVAGVTNQEGLADFWVLVDGIVRFKRREVNGFQGAMSVAVPIGSTDRFLTLAATDGGNGIGKDWTMFGDARLELVPRTAKSGDEKRAP